MIVIYPILVTYHKLTGTSASPEESEKYFRDEGKANGYIARMLRLHTGTNARIHYGNFEVEEDYI